MTMIAKSNKRYWPLHGWLGLALITLFWILNWTSDGLRTHWMFFPLWLGYCLTVDALVVTRKGHSMLLRNGKAWLMLFIISVPVWWLFELFNLRAQNWFYDGREFFTDGEYALIASLNFSTVIPAVFGTAELAGTWNWIKKFAGRSGLKLTRNKCVAMFVLGWLMIALFLVWPEYFFVFMWLSVFFIVEPVNIWSGRQSLLVFFSKGDFRPLLALWTGCLICGFFWEMWNFYSYPKWIYRVPFVGFWHIFEMPLIGYLGYLPFSLELYTIYHFITGSGASFSKKQFVQI